MEHFRIVKKRKMVSILSKANAAKLRLRLEQFTKMTMGIHKGVRWVVEDEWLEEFIKVQRGWLDFLDGK